MSTTAGAGEKGASGFVGFRELPVRIAAAQVPREGPDIVRLDGIARRAGADIAVTVARDRSNIGVEAHRDPHDLPFDRSGDDRRALDRDQAVLKDMAIGGALGD